MVEFTAVILCLGIIMVYLLYLSFSLSDNYDPLKMFLIGVSMFFGAILLNVGKEVVVANSGSAGMSTSLDVAYWAWLVITGLVLTYFVIYMIIRAWNSVAGKNKLKLYDEENR